MTKQQKQAKVDVQEMVDSLVKGVVAKYSTDVDCSIDQDAFLNAVDEAMKKYPIKPAVTLTRKERRALKKNDKDIARIDDLKERVEYWESRKSQGKLVEELACSYQTKYFKRITKLEKRIADRTAKMVAGDVERLDVDDDDDKQS